MKSIVLDVPMFGFVVATRALLGVGLGLALSERLPNQRRKAAAAFLIAAGVLTTIPAVQALRRSNRSARRDRPGVDYDGRLIGASRFPRKGDEAI
jgi:uncharacterized membrane protein YidH (DUF202 family)